MAISKRLRYEILRRDNHTCRYCGGCAPDVALTVDHVMPVTLGGTDEPSNLVAACGNCNTGKTSSTPGAPLVADVAQDALRWAAAMQACAQIQRTLQADVDTYLDDFEREWNSYTYGYRDLNYRLPLGWQSSLEAMYKAGLRTDDLEQRVAIAMHARDVEVDNRFRYFCGVVWRVIRERQDMAREYLATADGTEE